MHYRTPMAALVAGVKTLLPLTPGVVPFGLVTGVMAIEMGMTPTTVMGMTLLFYSGTAQIAALQLISNNVFALTIILTALVINLRFLMYSASLAPYLHHLPRRWTWPLSYMLADQSYAVSVLKLSSGELGRHAHYYYAGATVTMWATWQLSVLAGIYLSAGIPPEWSLEFTVPLSFLALLIPSIRNSPALVAALVGGVVGVLAIDMPFNLGLVTASLCGILAGLATERWRPVRPAAGTDAKEPCNE